MHEIPTISVVERANPAPLKIAAQDEAGWLAGKAKSEQVQTNEDIMLR